MTALRGKRAAARAAAWHPTCDGPQAWRRL